VTLEETLQGWTGPSSPTEQERQERTERMIKEAVSNHPGFGDCDLSVYTKGSYANNTNVLSDSDVDVVVQCHNVRYWECAPGAQAPTVTPYTGPWTPSKFRSEVAAALKAKLPGDVDESGSTALTVKSSSARVDADVVPCFDYRYHFASGGFRDGTKVFRKSGQAFVNYPTQQLDYGRQKNNRTNNYYKQAVRILKRCENAMVDKGKHRTVQSFFVECLSYRCPDEIFGRATWTDTVRGLLVHIWDGLQGPEPEEEAQRWLEANDCKFLFHNSQPWSRADGRDFAKAAWNYLGYAT